MSSITTRLVTGASTNLTRLSQSPALILEGIIPTNTAAYAIFVKFYWFDQSLQAATTPTVGTTVPNLTLSVPAASTLPFYFGKDGLYGKGDLWVAVTKLAADTDTTVTVAGDGLITFMLG
jgi:hypothetical protein